jgi:NAD(P)-dependent dehydrogenase (short-subunit alcohol dehydrogenase family)
MNLLENKIALVTGAGSGIGKAIAQLYAREGAKLVLTDISEKAGEGSLAEIKKVAGQGIFIKADSSIPSDNERVVSVAMKEFGALHIAVNNAGIGGTLKYVGEYPVDDWERVISVNLSGVFYGMRYQIPAILSSGGGSIVNIASIMGRVAVRGSSAYVAAKHGVIGLTETAALEYAKQNLRVNSIGPGYISTPLLMNMLDEARLKYLEGLHPMGRLGKPEEVAELALWLNSDKASFVTGSYYNMDGGYLAQ